MPTTTYLPIANISISSPTTSIVFSNITQQYRDLVLVCSFIYPTTAIQNPRMTINNDSSNSYKLVYLDSYASGSNAVGVDDGTNFSLSYTNTSLNSHPIISVANFMDYSATDKHKHASIRYGTPSSGHGFYGVRYAASNAITSMEIYATNSLSWQAGTTLTLYGVHA